MYFFDETSTIQHIPDIYTPLASEFMWTLNCDILDFTLSPIQMLEEISCPALEIRSPSGGIFVLPASWHILICDRDTAQLDVITLAEFAGREFSAFTYGPKQAHSSHITLSVTNYVTTATVASPCLQKVQMLCHPVNETEWICVSPSDPYNKYLKDKIIGDLVSY